MKIIIKTTGIKLTEALSDYVEKKIRPLEKFLKDFIKFNSDSKVDERKGRTEILIDIGKELGKTKGAFMSKAQVILPGKTLNAKVVSYDLLESVDFLKDELQRKIVDLKEKPISIKKRNARSIKKDFKLDPGARMYRKGRIREEGL